MSSFNSGEIGGGGHYDESERGREDEGYKSTRERFCEAEGCGGEAEFDCEASSEVAKEVSRYRGVWFDIVQTRRSEFKPAIRGDQKLLFD